MQEILSQPTEDEHKARKVLMEVVYLCLSVFLFLILLLSGSANFASPAQRLSAATQGLIAVAALVSFIASRRGYTKVGAHFLPYGILLLTIALINSTGLGSANALFFVTIIVVAGMTTGIRGVVTFAVLSAVTAIGLFVAQTQGLLANKTPVGLVTLAIILAHIVGDTFGLFVLMRTFTRNLQSALEANKALRHLQTSLEQRVAERTRDLEMAAQVSRQITRVLDMERLLPELAEKTRQGFNLHHVSLYLYDPQREEFRLEVGAGQAGALIKTEAQVLHLGAHPSLVAQVARERKAGIINEMATSALPGAQPHPPQARAEAAFPMLIGDDLVGVLDLLSDTAGRFQEGDSQIFATLAEQIAIAVRNAQLYRQQARLAQELEQADLMKSQFLASMSHELRTPLNAIINFTQLLAMGVAGPVTEEQSTMLNTSLGSSRHLLQLINDVLDISKIQAGKLSLYIETDVNLKTEIQAAVDMAVPLLQKQNAGRSEPIQLIQDIDPDLPLAACDRRRTRQVLLNLLSNAIKFTEHGSITLSAKKQGDDCLFAVMDTGPGIPEAMHARIFEPFVQAADDLKHIQGTGLGLPISRSLAQAHGGDLWVESTLGEGTTFFFTLPFRPALAPQ